MQTVLAALGKLIFKLFGGKALDLSERLTRYAPPITKFVMIVAPHTSNWDFVIAFFARYMLRYGNNTEFLAKHTLFKPPFGRFFMLSEACP